MGSTRKEKVWTIVSAYLPIIPLIKYLFDKWKNREKKTCLILKFRKRQQTFYFLNSFQLDIEPKINNRRDLLNLPDINLIGKVQFRKDNANFLMNFLKKNNDDPDETTLAIVKTFDRNNKLSEYKFRELILKTPKSIWGLEHNTKMHVAFVLREFRPQNYGRPIYDLKK